MRNGVGLRLAALGSVALGLLSPGRGGAEAPPVGTASKPSVSGAPTTSASVAATSAHTTLTTTTGKATRVAVDDSAVYWTSGQKLLAVDKTGGAVRTVATSKDGLSGLRALGGKPYWLSGTEQVYALAKPPTPTLLRDFHAITPKNTAPQQVMVGEFFAGAGGLACALVARTSGESVMWFRHVACFDTANPKSTPEIETDLLNTIDAFAADDKRIYYAQGGDDGFYSASWSTSAKVTGKPVKLLVPTDPMDGLVAADGVLFWFEKVGLVSLSTASTPPTRIVLAGGAAGSDIEVDATHVWYRSAGKILRVARAAGSKPTTFAGSKVDCFTLDATTVYWIDGGTLFKAPKGLTSFLG